LPVGRRRIFCSRVAGWKVETEGAIVGVCRGKAEGKRWIGRSGGEREGKPEVCLLKIWG
jgi:hypothetical protein